MLREQQGQPQRPTAWIEDQNSNSTSPYISDDSISSHDSQEVIDSNSTNSPSTSLQDGTTTVEESAQLPDAPANEEGGAGTFEFETNPPAASDLNTTAAPVEPKTVYESPLVPVSDADSSDTFTMNTTVSDNSSDVGSHTQTNVTGDASAEASGNVSAEASGDQTPSESDAGSDVASDGTAAAGSDGDQERRGPDGLTAIEEATVEDESEAESEAEDVADDTDGRRMHRRLRFE